jgi:hypothetical protein
MYCKGWNAIFLAKLLLLSAPVVTCAFCAARNDIINVTHFIDFNDFI